MSNAPKQPKPLGFHLAVGVAVVCAAAVLFIIFRAMTAPPAGPAGSGELFGTGVAPEILGEGSGAKGLHIQVMDRDDATRLSAELRSDTLEPMAAQRYSVTEPRATIYLQDGRVAHVRSRGGTLVIPDRQRAPETGTLTDQVEVCLFEPRPDGGAPDIERDTPMLTWRGSSLTFDATLGQASTNESFVLTAPEFVFKAGDASMSINQTLERLERFAVRQGGTLLYTDRSRPEHAGPEAEQAAEPDAKEHGREAGDRRPVGGADAPGRQPVEQAPQRTPPVTFYQAIMRDGIRLSRAGQEITSDRLDVFARTIDGKLPADAIAQFTTADREAPSDDGRDPAPPPDRAQAAPPAAQAGTVEPAGDEGVTTLVWTGPLEVHPLSTEPTELAANHLLARFTSEQSGVVSFAESASEASGRAALVEYGFTEARLVLSGPSQGRSVQVKSPSLGEASMGRLELPLGAAREADAVDAHIPGPFTVIGSDGISRIDSGEKARLRFAVEHGRLTGRLLEAEFVGTVKASDRNSWIEAERMVASFDPDEHGQSRISRLRADRSVRMDDGSGGSGRCDALDAAFATDTEHPLPRAFVATGNVSFRDQTGKIDADALRTELRQIEGGAVEVTRFWAEGSIALRRLTDQIDITGERLYADADEQYLEVESPGGQARVQRGPTVIRGTLVQLNGNSREARVDGEGSFEHRAGKGDTASAVHATWTEGMAFSDTEGKMECLGDVAAVHEPDGFTREAIQAAVLRVEFAPVGGQEIAEAPGDEPLDNLAETDREIHTLFTGGRAYLGVGEELAIVESATYATPRRPPTEADPGAEPVLARAFRLSGVEIHSNGPAGTLDVPGRGRLFIADLRVPSEEQDDSTGRGAALFDWLGSLHADRNLGTSEMLEGVSMSHVRANDGARSLLESDRLRIRFAPGDKDSDELFSGLRSAIAETGVYLRTDSREMTADLLEYDPQTGVARALGDSFDGVRILDRATGSPMTASAMIWNLTTDRVDIVDPTVITIPR